MEFTEAPPLDTLLDLYALPDPRWCRANAVMTVTGHVTGADERSGSINSSSDMAVFTAIRALSDVVVVGSGTARKERYRRLRSDDPAVVRARRDEGRSDHPALAIITGSGDLPERLLDMPDHPDDQGRLLVLCTEQTPAMARSRLVERLGKDAVITAGVTEVEPLTALAGLRKLGLDSVLCEGGPSVYGGWIGAGAIDELCLTQRPLLLRGEGPRLLGDSGSSSGLDQVGSATPSRVIQIGDDMMVRYRINWSA